MVKWDHNIYHSPAYSVADAARYLHIPRGTLRSWLHGRSYSVKEGKQYVQPLLQRPNPDLPEISFTNLVEAHVLRSIRKIHCVRLDRIRGALDYLDQQFGMPHPLARVEFQTDGVNLFVESVGRLVSVSQNGQLTMKGVLNHLLTRVEWNELGVATRLFPSICTTPLPQPKDEPRTILIDPRISFGRPVIVNAWIPTQDIAERYKAGESPESIADDLGCDLCQVYDAIRFEL